MLGWIFGIVGVVGVGGAIALAILAPVLAREILAIVLDVAAKIWSTRLGCAGMTATACILFGYFYFDAEGYSRCKARWDAADAAALSKVIKADSNAAEKARAVEDRDVATEFATELENQKARDAYIKDLEKRAASVCTDSPDDVKRLRGIR